MEWSVSGSVVLCCVVLFSGVEWSVVEWSGVEWSGVGWSVCCLCTEGLCGAWSFCGPCVV